MRNVYRRETIKIRREEKCNICINKITELCFVLAVKNYYFALPQMLAKMVLLTKMTYMGKRKGGFGFRYAERWIVYFKIRNNDYKVRGQTW